MYKIEQEPSIKHFIVPDGEWVDVGEDHCITGYSSSVDFIKLRIIPVSEFKLDENVDHLSHLFFSREVLEKYLEGENYSYDMDDRDIYDTHGRCTVDMGREISLSYVKEDIDIFDIDEIKHQILNLECSYIVESIWFYGVKM